MVVHMDGCVYDLLHCKGVVACDTKDILWIFLCSSFLIIAFAVWLRLYPRSKQRCRATVLGLLSRMGQRQGQQTLCTQRRKLHKSCIFKERWCLAIITYYKRWSMLQSNGSQTSIKHPENVNPTSMNVSIERQSQVSIVRVLRLWCYFQHTRSVRSCIIQTSIEGFNRACAESLMLVTMQKKSSILHQSCMHQKEFMMYYRVHFADESREVKNRAWIVHGHSSWCPSSLKMKIESWIILMCGAFSQTSPHSSFLNVIVYWFQDHYVRRYMC